MLVSFVAAASSSLASAGRRVPRARRRRSASRRRSHRRRHSVRRRARLHLVQRRQLQRRCHLQSRRPGGADGAGHHRGGLSHPSVRGRIHGRRPGATGASSATMNLFVASMLVLVLADNRAGIVSGLGRRRGVLVPADRILVRGPRQRCRGAQGVHRHADRRRGLDRLPCSCSPGSSARCISIHWSRRARAAWIGGAPIAGMVGHPVVGRRHRQIGAGAAANLATRRDGRPHPGQRSAARRDHGHGRRLL